MDTSENSALKLGNLSSLKVTHHENKFRYCTTKSPVVWSPDLAGAAVQGYL